MSLKLGCIALAACALSLQGCSDEAVTPDAQSAAGSGSSSSAGAGAAGAAGAAGQVGGGSAGGAAGGAGQAGGPAAGGALPCESYVDDPTWSLLVTIKNETTETLYLGQETSSCQVERLFEVQDGARTVLPALQSCRNSCQALMQTGPVACPEVCATPATVTLEPGQSLQVPWDGRFGVESSLPQACAAGQQPPAGSCVRAERVEANAYTFIARAGTKRACLGPDGACVCTPSATGGCSSPQSLITGTIITTELFLKLEPGEPSTTGEPPYIGLVFKN